MKQKVTFTVDGNEVSATEHTPLIHVLSAMEINVPSLCHHPAIKPYGACRLCLVEIQKGRKHKCVTSCNYPVTGSIAVVTDSDRLRKIRRTVIELLLLRAPEDPCLLELAERHGASRTRLAPSRKTNDCILCGQCVRVCRDVVGGAVLTFLGRGVGRTVGTAFDELPETCIGCGACAAVCPTGAVDVALSAIRRFRRKTGADRFCRYALMGLVPGAVCARSYQCESCEVEHRFAVTLMTHPIMLAEDVEIEPTRHFVEQRWRARQ